MGSSDVIMTVEIVCTWFVAHIFRFYHFLFHGVSRINMLYMKMSVLKTFIQSQHIFVYLHKIIHYSFPCNTSSFLLNKLYCQLFWGARSYDVHVLTPYSYWYCYSTCCLQKCNNSKRVGIRTFFTSKIWLSIYYISR